MTTQPRSNSHFPAVPLALLLVAGGVASHAHGQWTVVNLHPKWAPSSEARGVQNGQQVGFAGAAGQDAILWTGSAASARVLDPTPAFQAAAVCIDGDLQGGRAEVEVDGLPKQHAALWNGSAKTFVDLHPADASNSLITAMQGGTQGGVWFPVEEGGLFTLGRACLWHGTPESFVDLTPPGITATEVHGVFGDVQVGANFDLGLARACMWRGTPDSYVDLQPVEALFSTAECADATHQYGAILTWDGMDPSTFHTDLGYWTGEADSWTSLTPPGFFGAAITAVHGERQVGVLSEDPVGNGPFHAGIWSGTTESFEDLQPYLPAVYTESWAYGVWTDPKGTTYVVGAAHNSELDRIEAVMWVSGGAACRADFNNSGDVNSQDLFDFLGAFFEQAPAADFNGDGTVNSQDFFEFLTAFFEGC